MNKECEISDFEICEYEDKTVLVLNGSFVSNPGSMTVYAVINEENVENTHADITPAERGKGALKHVFEIEHAIPSVDSISSLKIVLKGSRGMETVLLVCDGNELKEHIKNTSIIAHIESFSFNDNRIGTIVGWSYSTMKDSVQYEIHNEQGCAVPLSLRRTVQQKLAERGAVAQKDSLCGFIISFEGSSEHSYTLQMKDNVHTDSISLDGYIADNNMNTGKIMHLMSLVNKRNIDRGILYLKKNGIGKFFKRLSQGVTDDMDYDAWFIRNRVTEDELQKQKEVNFSYEPLISILVPTFNTPRDLLNEMIQSVIQQSYSNWNLCIADGSNPDSEARKMILDYEKKDSRIKVVILKKNYGISGNTNKALELADGEYTALFDHDDVLEPDALYEIVKSLQKIRHDIVYTDEDKLNDHTRKLEAPNFKPDYNMDLFLSHNYITHFFVVKTSIIKRVGGFNSEYDGSQDYDVMFRCIEQSSSIHHVAKSLYHWRMHEGSTAMDPESKMYCYVAGQKAIQSHLDRIGIRAVVEMQAKPLFGLYHVKYKVPNEKVSIIIPSKDHKDVLKTCINSLFNVNRYRNFEIIIVENGSQDKETFDYYAQLQEEHSNVKVTVLNENEFNYSALNNYGASRASGSYLLFLNNDTEMIKPDAISEMIGVCYREDVGAVGAKLLYADNTIQHAGVIVGFSGYAGHVFNDIPNGKDYGYMTRDVLNADLSAVTGACLMTKRSVFQTVGGFDEQFKIACNDIDYCMKVVKSGKHVVYNAFSLWHHYESKSRGYENGFDKIVRFDKEVELWQKKWIYELLQGDPAYNRNFKIEDGPFILH